MGKPEDPQKYQELWVEDMQFYISKDIIAGLEEKSKELKFVVEGYGWFRIPIPDVRKDSGGKDEKNC